MAAKAETLAATTTHPATSASRTTFSSAPVSELPTPISREMVKVARRRTSRILTSRTNVITLRRYGLCSLQERWDTDALRHGGPDGGTNDRVSGTPALLDGVDERRDRRAGEADVGQPDSLDALCRGFQPATLIDEGCERLLQFAAVLGG